MAPRSANPATSRRLARAALAFLLVVVALTYGWLRPPGDGTPGLPGSSPSSPTPTLQAPSPPASTTGSGSAGDGSTLHYGLLRQTAPEEYLSPAGVRYSPGSAEGHRLAHLQRHLQDAPDRPGKHGVFAGDLPQVLQWIDEAYLMAQRKAAGSELRREQQRTIYEATFAQPIGFVGGRDGARDRHPKAYRLRLVLEDEQFITAFPF